MNPGDKLIKKPVYKGGRKALSKFLQTNLVYPDEALEKKIEGVVITYIDIDGNGNVVKVRLKKKLGFGCDEEAIRLVKLLTFFVKKKRKVRITHHKTIKVFFKLPVSKPVQQKITKTEVKKESQKVSSSQRIEISYTYVPSKKK